MRNDNDAKSSDADSSSPESMSSGFFMKYSPGDKDEPGPNAQRFFTRYLPPRETTEIHNQELSEVPEPETQTVLADLQAEHGSTATRRVNPVWPVLMLVALVPLLLGIWQAVRSRHSRINPSITDSSAVSMDRDQPIIPRTDNHTDPGILPVTNPSFAPSLIKGERRSNSIHSLSSSALPGPEVLLLRAREFEDRGMLERAEQEYFAILARFPNHQEGTQGLNRVLSSLSRQQTAETARRNRETGLKKFRSGDFSPAAMYLSASVEDGCSDTATLYSLGMSYLKLGRHSEAGRILDRCVAAQPDYAPALVGLAEVERARGSIDRAVLLLRRARELGGGAEFTPVRITEMISALEPETKTKQIQPKPVLIVTAVHQHALPFSRCRGKLTINDSEILFTSDKPSHSFRVSGDAFKNAHASGSQLNLLVGGKACTLTLEGTSAVDFIKTIGH
jgi:tetratricopeptide (TPR) repeat protein